MDPILPLPNSAPCQNPNTQNPYIPSIHFSDEIGNYWKNALFIRATSKPMDPIYFKQCIISLWKPSGEPSIQHIGFNCYRAHNLNALDRVQILTSKSRLGYDPLFIQLWKPNLRAQSLANSMITAIWIKLPLLPIEYHSPQLLISINNLIEKTVALDASKSKTLELNSTRICVEINIQSELPGMIFINNCYQEVINEILSFFPLIFLDHPLLLQNSTTLQLYQNTIPITHLNGKIQILLPKIQIFKIET